MKFRFAGVILIALSSVVSFVACGAAPPKPVNDAPIVDDAPDPQSSEWLYATKGLGSADVKAECEHVRAALKEESKCKGEACLYASRLGQDWVRRCKKADAASFDEMDALSRDYATRKDGERVPCMREIETILSRGCNDDPACADKAQEWTTRCSDETGSPLVVRILETRVMQARGGGAGSGGGSVKLDKRGCKGLAGDILGAANCAQKFACEDALTGVDTYRKRCLASGAQPALEEGLAELSIRLGAGQKTEPLTVAAGGALDPYLFAVTLADASGIVALVCGERAKDLNEYLSLRRDCTDGEVVILQRQPGRSKATLRTGRFAHPSDDAFLRNYPSLAAQGEMAARASAGIARLGEALGTVSQKVSAGAKYDPELGAQLIDALTKEAFAVRNSTDRSALAQRDSELEPLFRSLAKAKIEAVKTIFEPVKFAAFHRRSLKSPLADLGTDGSISAGALNVAAGLDLSQVLPKSFAAYRSELAVFAERVKKKPLSDKSLAELTDSFTRAVTACASAEGKVRESEGAIVECGFTTCDEQELKELAGELGNARIDSTVSHIKVLLAGDSLDQPPAASDKAPRCVEPWW
ncbi:MAG TPA: hypothetical protein VM686_15985 [Polyangiaceae bacterium]|nr:hypothetical protein [Polyangiaceae bacterium]